jgi:hypothetical protein
LHLQLESATKKPVSQQESRGRETMMTRRTIGFPHPSFLPMRVRVHTQALSQRDPPNINRSNFTFYFLLFTFYFLLLIFNFYEKISFCI